jgi:hypothetical protein
MRPLKRPMFKTGGPIKEGVMNGLRDGGVATTMADATMMAGGGMPNMRGRVTGPGGYKGDKKLSAMDKLKYAGSGYLGTEGALGIMDLMRYLFNEGGKVGEGLVGDPRYPQQGGRAMHSQYLFPETGTSSAMPRTKLNIKSIKEIPKTPGQAKKKIIAGAAKKLFPNTNFEGIGSKGLGIFKNFFDKRISLPKFRRPGFQKQGPLYKVPALERAGNFIRNNKLLTGAGVVYGTPAAVGTAKFAIDKGPGIIKGILDPTGFYRDKYGKVKKALGFEEEKTPPPGEDGTGRNLTIQQKGGTGPTQAEIDAKKKLNEEQRLNKIYKLLGVDRAKRNAASKALIDMSRYIDEGGKDVISKQNIGSTISKAIGAFDKRLDKVDQLKEAAGLMQAKGIIEKDIRSSDNELKELQKQKIRKDLQKNFSDLKLVSKIPGQKGVNIAAASSSDNYRGNLITQSDLSETIEKVKKNEGILDETVIIENITNETIKDKNIADGDYTVGDALVTIEQGKVTSVLR